MKKNIIKIMLLAGLLLLCSMSLSAQGNVAVQVEIVFHELNCESPSEEWNSFLWDYHQYGLTFMYALVTQGSSAHMGGSFIFNSSSIEPLELVSLLSNDPRVWIAFIPEYYDRPRKFFLLLSNDVDESDFLSDYSNYGLNGSILVNAFSTIDPNTRLYTFNDEVIYPGNLLNLIRLDDRVEFSRIYDLISDGVILLYFHENVSVEEMYNFFEDFPYVEFLPTANVPRLWRAVFDFIVYNEFTILPLFQADERISEATIGIGYFGPPESTICFVEPEYVLDTYETEIPLRKSIVYPNPVRYGENVTFKSNHCCNDSEISIYNIKGQKVKKATLREDTFLWNGKDEYETQVNSGIYLYQIKSETDVHTGKILIIK